MAMEVNSLSTSLLNNGAHFRYMEATITRIEANEIVKAKVSPELVILKQAFAVEDNCLKISQKSFLTDDIAKWDGFRDSYYRGYRATVKGLLKLPEGELLTHAKKLWQNTVDYKLDTHMQLDRQTGLMANMLSDLLGKLAASVEALGLTTFRDKMKEANDKVRELLDQRDDETAGRKAGAMKAARADTDDAYEALIKKVNAYALIEGDADYKDFIEQMNSMIKRYKQEALGQSSKKDDDKKEEKPTEDPKPENPGEETPTEPETPDEETPTEPTEPQPGVDSDGDGSPEVV